MVMATASHEAREEERDMAEEEWAEEPGGEDRAAAHQW